MHRYHGSMQSKAIFGVILSVAISQQLGCQGLGPGSGGDAHVDRVAGMLVGDFDSRDQASASPDEYYEIRLVTIPIWPDRKDGRWLYVEQAAFSSLDRPYRQRVYCINEDAFGEVRSDIYQLPGDPAAYAGAWRAHPSPFESLKPDQLEIREGCSIRLEPHGDGYIGSTSGRGCASTLAGSSYATSEVELQDGLIYSWDRGWDQAGAQAWGATGGGYRFVRRNQSPPK